MPQLDNKYQADARQFWKLILIGSYNIAGCEINVQNEYIFYIFYILNHITILNVRCTLCNLMEILVVLFRYYLIFKYSKEDMQSINQTLYRKLFLIQVHAAHKPKRMDAKQHTVKIEFSFRFFFIYVFCKNVLHCLCKYLKES